MENNYKLVCLIHKKHLIEEMEDDLFMSKYHLFGNLRDKVEAEWTTFYLVVCGREKYEVVLVRWYR